VQLSLWGRVLARIRELSQKAILAAKLCFFLTTGIHRRSVSCTAFHPRGRCLWASITLLLPPYYPQSPTPSAGTASAWLQLWEPHRPCSSHLRRATSALSPHLHPPSKANANFRVTEQHKDEELHFRAVSSISNFESEPWLTRLCRKKSVRLLDK
jgi:hypothetical protein